MTVEQTRRLGLMRWASLAEATSQNLQIAVAMPLLIWAGVPQAAQIVGPLRRAAFVASIPMAGNVSECWTAARHAAA